MARYDIPPEVSELRRSSSSRWWWLVVAGVGAVTGFAAVEFVAGGSPASSDAPMAEGLPQDGDADGLTPEERAELDRNDEVLAESLESGRTPVWPEGYVPTAWMLSAPQLGEAVEIRDDDGELVGVWLANLGPVPIDLWESPDRDLDPLLGDGTNETVARLEGASGLMIESFDAWMNPPSDFYED